MMNTGGRDLQTLFDVGVTGVLSDGQLLDRFVARREGAVFEAIVHRHGPMVWGVCRRVLRDHHDAEDAFQATFLVLARKAVSIKPREKIGNWLYGVAYQTAMKARATKARRRVRESQVLDVPEPEAVSHDLRDDLAEALDRELSRLPEKYRVPLVLCELEGKTHREAAEQLGWPIGTVSGRLSRARAMLARRLTRRGVSISVGSLAVLLAQNAASASMPTKLIGSTAQAASLFAAGRAVAAGMFSAEVSALTEGMLKTMLLSKLKIITAALLVGASLTTLGLGLMIDGPQWGDETKADAKNPKADAKNSKGDTAKLQGKWIAKVGINKDEDLIWEIKGEKLIQKGKTGQGEDYTTISDLILDETADPKHLDQTNFTVKIGDRESNQPLTVLAIYMMEGEKLIVCSGAFGPASDSERPESFQKSEKGGPPIVFERAKDGTTPKE